MKRKIFAITAVLLAGMTSISAGTVPQDRQIVRKIVIVDSIFKNVISELVYAPCRKQFYRTRFHSLKFCRSFFLMEYIPFKRCILYLFGYFEPGDTDPQRIWKQTKTIRISPSEMPPKIDFCPNSKCQGRLILLLR